MLIQRSFKPPPLSVLRIAGGQVVLALAGYLEAGFLEGGDHVGAAPHHAVLDPLQEVVADQLARAGFHFKAGPEPCRLNVGAMARLLRLGPRRVVGAAPAMLVVEGVAQRVEGLLPAGGRDVQAASGLQVAACGEDVYMNPVAVLAVEDRRPGVAVRFQPRPGRLLELVENGPDLIVGRAVLRRPRDHARGVRAPERQRVGDVSYVVGVPAQDLDTRAHPPRGVAFADEIVGGRAGRARAATEEPSVHRCPLRQAGPGRAANARPPSTGRAPGPRRGRRRGCSPSARAG